MRRTLTAALAALALAAACGDSGDSGGAATSGGAHQPTTTTTAAAATDGLLDPPGGVTQTQADRFAAGLASDLDTAGWPRMDRDVSIGILQSSLEIAVTTCALIDTDPRGDWTLLLDEQAQQVSAALAGQGASRGEADALMTGWVDGVTAGMAGSVCPEHAAVLG